MRAVSLTQVAGAVSSVIFPLSMVIPRFPPVPSFPFQSPDGVRVVSDAGSIQRTIQLLYEPIPVDKAQSPGPRQQLRKVFDLRAFDYRAKETDLELLRPWVLEVLVGGLTEAFEDPGRLLLARYEDSKGWVPLITHYHRTRGILQARVLRVGRFAVLAESRVTPG